MGPESSADDFTIGSTIQSKKTSQFLNIQTASTSYKPLVWGTTGDTTAWGLEGDTIITTTGSSYGRRKDTILILRRDTLWDSWLIHGNRAELSGLPVFTERLLRFVSADGVGNAEWEELQQLSDYSFALPVLARCMENNKILWKVNKSFRTEILIHVSLRTAGLDFQSQMVSLTDSVCRRHHPELFMYFIKSKKSPTV